MRLHPLLLVLILLPTAPAQDHDEMQTHLSVKVTELAAGAQETVPIATGEGPWLKGMVLMVYVAFASEPSPLIVDFQFEDDTLVHRFIFNKASGHQSTLVPQDGGDGDYQLNLRNEGNATLQFFLYFDQTCACAAKPIPFPDGYVVFHFDLLGGKTYNIGIPSVDGWKLTAFLTRKTAEAAQWPDDFFNLDQASVEGKGWLNVSYRPAADERIYLWVQAEEGVTFPPPDPSQWVQITPLVEIVEPPKKSPPASPLFVILALVAAPWGYRMTSKQSTGAPKSKA